MMNSLLNRVENTVSNSNFVTKIADFVLNLIVPKTTIIAGEYCGCSPECERMEWHVFGSLVKCLVCGEPGSCQPC